VRATLGTIIDAISEAQGLIEKDADNQGLAPECFAIDMADLSDLWRKMDDSEPSFGDIRRLAGVKS
jgi:hypothetical protein